MTRLDSYGMTYPIAYYLADGQTVEVPINFLDSGSYSYTLESRNESIVKVNGHQITACGVGETSVQIQAQDEARSRTMRGGIAVYVGLKLNYSEYTLRSVGTTFQLKPTYNVFLNTSDPFATGGEYWSVTEGADVVRVSADGVVTALRKGTATVQLRVPTNAGEMKATCQVTVELSQPSEIELSAESWNMGVGEKIRVAVWIDKNTESRITFTSSETGVAWFGTYAKPTSEIARRAPEGKTLGGVMELTAASPGETTVTVKAENGVSASKTVRVYGDGFKYEDPDIAMEKAVSGIQKVLAEIISIFKAQKETSIDNVEASIQKNFIAATSLPPDAQKVFAQKMFQALDSMNGDESKDYTKAKTEAELIKAIFSTMDSGKKGSFTFEAGNTVYTCKYTVMFEFWGAKLIQDAAGITDDRGNTYVLASVMSNETNIETEMANLRDLAELKVEEAENAYLMLPAELLKDTKAFKAWSKGVQGWIGKAAGDSMLSLSKKRAPALAEKLPKLLSNLKSLWDLWAKAEAARKGLSLEGALPESVVRTIGEYHTKAEAFIEAVDGLL